MIEAAVKINEIIRDHVPTKGMAPTMGTYCVCGYSTGDERPGIDRPPGVRDPLDWHRANLIVKAMGLTDWRNYDSR